MGNSPHVVVLKGKVYVGGGWAQSDSEKQTVMVYDPQQDNWDKLPQYIYRYFSIAVVNDQLVLVGGEDVQTNKTTNKLGMWNEQSRTWTMPFPPMTTACSSPAIAVTRDNRWLVVIGGLGDGFKYSRVQGYGFNNPLSVVQIMDLSTQRWHPDAPLPQSCTHLTSAMIDNVLILLGGFSTSGSSKQVFSVCIDNLISQTVSQPTGVGASPTLSLSPWQVLPDTPQKYSTALSVHGVLFAVGGTSDWSAIYHYQPSNGSWVKLESYPPDKHHAVGTYACC